MSLYFCQEKPGSVLEPGAAECVWALLLYTEQ